MKNLPLIIGIAICITGCSKLRKSWTKPDFNGAHFNKIGVIGMGFEIGEKQDREALCVGLLTNEGLSAYSGTMLFPAESNDSIQQKIVVNKLDAIIVISILKKNDNLLPENYNSFSKFYSHRFTDLNVQRYLQTDEKYVIQGYLYDFTQLRDGDLVWWGEMALLDPENSSAKERFIRRMVNELVGEKLLLKTEDQQASLLDFK